MLEVLSAKITTFESLAFVVSELLTANMIPSEDNVAWTQVSSSVSYERSRLEEGWCVHMLALTKPISLQ
jgi:hypothetical protein